MTGAMPVLPLLGILGRLPLPEGCAEAWAENWGPPVLISPAWDFTATEYYAAEMGSPLVRMFRAFAPRPPALVEWKEAAGRLEARWSDERGRRVNLDPGYVSLGALVLASTQPSGHRIRLARGIHAEVTLYFHRGAWTPLPWTFPDFAGGLYDEFLGACRARLREALRGAAAAHPPDSRHLI